MSQDLNPFATTQTPGAMVQVEQTRAMSEVQSAMIIAKNFPRDERVAMDSILKNCTRPSLAEQAIYAYPRGGQTVSGPSIRLAETIAQSWGNIQFGIREIEQSENGSTMEAFAWDLQSNTMQTKEFFVPHVRRSNNENKQLIDPRDIYEMTANMGSRRMRACILSIIPGDVVEKALEQCAITQKNSFGAPEEQIEKMISAFEELGVSKEMLNKRLGHNIEGAVTAQLIQLRGVYRSIKDGIGKISDFFEVEPEVNDKANTSNLNQKIKENDDKKNKE